MRRRDIKELRSDDDDDDDATELVKRAHIMAKETRKGVASYSIVSHRVKQYRAIHTVHIQ